MSATDRCFLSCPKKAQLTEPKHCSALLRHNTAEFLQKNVMEIMEIMEIMEFMEMMELMEMVERMEKMIQMVLIGNFILLKVTSSD